jgi:hypothetical protein
MRYCVVTVLGLLCWACQPAATSATEQTNRLTAEDSAKRSEPLYPFVQYLNEQIAFVDSTPFAIEKITYLDGKQIDSALIGRPEFLQLAALFCQSDVNSTTLRPLYSEESFNDLTLDNLTFSITALKPNLPLQQATILLLPETKRVKNVILQLNKTMGDSSLSQNLLWVHNQSFQISSTLYYQNQRQTRTTKVIWDKP